MVKLIFVGGVWKPPKLTKFGLKFCPQGFGLAAQLGIGLTAVGVSTRSARWFPDPSDQNALYHNPSYPKIRVFTKEFFVNYPFNWKQEAAAAQQGLVA